jgi:hypothetical protein
LNPPPAGSKTDTGQGVTQTVAEHLARSLACEPQKPAAEGPAAKPTASPVDRDLARVVDAWPALPAPLKAAVLALIRIAKPAP